jgi:hypothetical protein
MVDFGVLACDAPFGRGLWWTFDCERLPVLSVEGFLTREEANAFVSQLPDKRSCVPEAVAVSLVSVFSGLVPSGQLEFHWVGASRPELN